MMTVILILMSPWTDVFGNFAVLLIFLLLPFTLRSLSCVSGHPSAAVQVR
jgi:hypothetical protein